MKKILIGLTLAVVIVVGLRELLRNDETLVRHALLGAAKAASSEKELAPLDAAQKAQQLRAYLKQGVSVELELHEKRKRAIEGLREVIDAVVMLNAKFSPVDIRFSNLTIELAADRKSAIGRGTVLVTSVREEFTESVEIEAFLERVKRDWLITKLMAREVAL